MYFKLISGHNSQVFKFQRTLSTVAAHVSLKVLHEKCRQEMLPQYWKLDFLADRLAGEAFLPRSQGMITFHRRTGQVGTARNSTNRN